MTKTKYNPETTNWNDSYLLGIPMIDNQHKKFFVILDNLDTLNQKQEKSEMHSLINELQNYVIYHFKTEEDLMVKSQSPNIDLHIMEHELFRKKVEEFHRSYYNNNAELLNEMISFMRKWLLIHISGTDAEYADSIKSTLGIQ
ncbi:bacteriohemerythrin [Macellibacteroides fermentans]|uniref:bacteriohemerythrin n=1 Tax=Macellibacteroides fermentans TaxID=879969 RepID=UPI00406D2735